VLGIKDASDAVSRLEDDEKGTGITGTLGGQQEVLVISESGLYALIFRSRKPAAVRFRKWVTQEVLPAIRTAGSYTAPKVKRNAVEPEPAELRAIKARVTQLNATTRAMREIRLTLGIREAAKAAPALVKPLGITIDVNNADCFRQGDLDFPPGGGNA
jgi:prophage antirepressor-like protein